MSHIQLFSYPTSPYGQKVGCYGMFRGAYEWQSSYNSIRNGWKLSRAVSDATPLPRFVRLIWPFGVKRAPQQEFIEHLAGGDFFAGRSQLTMADLSAFPIVVNAYMMGMRAKSFWLDEPEINAWAKRVSAHLPENPLLVPDKFIERRLA